MVTSKNAEKVLQCDNLIIYSLAVKDDKNNEDRQGQVVSRAMLALLSLQSMIVKYSWKHFYEIISCEIIIY